MPNSDVVSIRSSARVEQNALLVNMVDDVFQQEAKALTRSAPIVSGNIVAAAHLMAQSSGRVIVTGVGKSGHVARKVAATLASIGKPAYFVHATEASHGDLGKLSADDIVMAFSNSGETPELSDIIQFARGEGLPLIAVTAGRESALARYSSHAIIYPTVEEVCIIGRAPTTSTVVMMSIGDALAVALSHLLGTTDADFVRNHPGGSLGAKLQQVADVMHTGAALPVVECDASMHEAMIEISRKALGVTLVKDVAGAVAGLITDGDLRRTGPDVWQQRASDVANFNPKTISQNALLVDALKQMQEMKVTCLLAVDDLGALCGLVHIHDCLRATR